MKLQIENIRSLLQELKTNLENSPHAKIFESEDIIDDYEPLSPSETKQSVDIRDDDFCVIADENSPKSSPENSKVLTSSTNSSLPTFSHLALNFSFFKSLLARSPEINLQAITEHKSVNSSPNIINTENLAKEKVLTAIELFEKISKKTDDFEQEISLKESILLANECAEIARSTKALDNYKLVLLSSSISVLAKMLSDGSFFHKTPRN